MATREMEEEIAAQVEREIDEHLGGEINDREFRIIVPKTDHDGRRINPDIYEEIVHDVSERFGGATVYPETAGCWVNDDGDLMCDENLIIITVRDSSDDVPFTDDREWFQDLSKRIGDDLGQFAVMMAEGVMEAHFIEGEFRESLDDGMIAQDDPLRRLV